jgi:serine/threonine protein kinase
MKLRELKSLRKLVHPNIVKLKEVIRVNNQLSFVFEYVERNIFSFYSDYKKKGEILPEKIIKSIFY